AERQFTGAETSMGNTGNTRTRCGISFTRSPRRRAAMLALSAAASVTGVARVANAALYTWSATATTSFWNANNWSTFGSTVTKPAAAGDTVVFAGNSNFTSNGNDFAINNTTPSAITFNS